MTTAPMLAPPNERATFSPDRKYRYTLTRDLANVGPSCLWIMLNPSTADALSDDATVRRCRAFSLSWGCSEMEVVNLFAYRSTDPKRLFRVDDPVGPDNDQHIREAVERHRGERIVAAWGSRGVFQGRGDSVLDILYRKVGRHGVHAFGMTIKTNQPRHPLYLASNTKLEAMR